MKKRAKSAATVTLAPPVGPVGSHGLYHLPDDPGERNDLSEKHPAELKRLRDRMEQLVAAGRSRPPVK